MTANSNAMLTLTLTLTLKPNPNTELERIHYWYDIQILWLKMGLKMPAF